MAVLYFAFSNSQTDPLPNLQAEYTDLQDILSPRAYRQHYFLKMHPFSTIAQVCSTIALYRERLFLFHYSGHADRDILLLEEELARAEGLVQLLGNCPQLKLVFLNGCSTDGMVEALLRAGVKAVIATSAKVDDKTAHTFSNTFYAAMERGETLDKAFDLAKATLQTGTAITIHRGIMMPGDDPKQAKWGLFYTPEQETTAVNTKLPEATVAPPDPNFEPNRQLLDTLFATLAEVHPKVRGLQELEARGEHVEEGDKQKEILNALPIPIAEHLRKLLCPVGTETDGFDQVGLRRLEQITTVYQMAMELLAFTLIAQVWEVLLDQEEAAGSFPQEMQDSLRAFFATPQADRKSFDYIPLIRQLRRYLDDRKVAYFIQELGTLTDWFQEKAAFAAACDYLFFVRRQISAGLIGNADIPEMCRRAEHSLSLFLADLGFLAKYTLASVKDIDIRKYRHQKQATYNHALVKLMRVMGKLEENKYVLDKFLDNRSVMLVKDQGMRFDSKTRQFYGQELAFLSLAPFVIDENAFIENTDISKLYFFQYLDAANGRYYFKHVKKPEEDTLLEVSAASKFDAVKEQFDVFCAQVLGTQPSNPV
ncbi:MAG: hypothetical protein RL386_619 [Bacteroidota bacterium]